LRTASGLRKTDEDPYLNQAALRALQNHPSQRQRDDYLFEPEAQAEAGLSFALKESETGGTHRRR
jgi:hypothetical protein